MIKIILVMFLVVGFVLMFTSLFLGFSLLENQSEMIIHVMFGCFILGAILSVIGVNGYSNLKFNVNADKEGIE